MLVRYDQPYSAQDGASLAFDLFLPDGPKPMPLVVCIHGGGWITGDKSMMHEVAAWLSSLGFAAACVSYRLAPLYAYPTAILDVQSAISHFRADAESLGIDPAAIASLGNSAGGYLAAMAGLRDTVVNGYSSRVNAVVDISGIADLSAPSENHFDVSRSFLEQFMGCAYHENPEQWDQAGPISCVNEGAPPFLLVHGEADDIVPVEQSMKLAGRLQSAGAYVDLATLPGEGHAYTFAGWGRTQALIEEFLAKILRHERVA